MFLMSEFAFGVGLNILGSLCINLGTNVVKYAHVESENKEKEEIAHKNGDKHHPVSLLNGSHTEHERASQNGVHVHNLPDDQSSTGSVEDEGCKPPLKEKFEKTPKSFYLGWGLFIFGNGLNFASFSFAPQSVLAALGSVQFVANVFFGAAVLKQPITWRITFATLAIVLGNVLLVVASNKDTQDFDSKGLLDAWKNTVWLVYVAVIVVGTIVLHICYRHLLQLTNPVHRLMLTHLASMDDDEFSQRLSVGQAHSKLSMNYQDDADLDAELDELSSVESATTRPQQPEKSYSKLIPFSYAAVSGMIGSQSVMLAKSASILFKNTIQGDNQFTFFFTYVIFFLWGVTIVFWLYRMNNALKMFDGVFIIPALQVIWIFFSVLGGGIYFQEFNDLEAWQYAVFVIGMIIVFAGVYGLAPDKPTEQQIARATSMPRSSISRTQVFNLNDDDAYRSSISRLSRTISCASSYSAFLSQPHLKTGQTRNSRLNIGPLQRNGSNISRNSSRQHYAPVFQDGSLSSPTIRRTPSTHKQIREDSPTTPTSPSFPSNMSPSPPNMNGISSETDSQGGSQQNSRHNSEQNLQKISRTPSLRIAGEKSTKSDAWRNEKDFDVRKSTDKVDKSQTFEKSRENSASGSSEQSMFGNSVVSSTTTDVSGLESPKADVRTPTGGMRNMLFRARHSIADMFMFGGSSGYDSGGAQREGYRERTTSEMDLLVRKDEYDAMSKSV